MLVNFKSNVRITSNIVKLLTKRVGMHVYGSVMINEIHRDDLWITIGIERSYSSDRLAIEKLYYFIL